MNKLNFLKNAIRYPFLVGTFFPSQKHLIQRIVGQIPKNSRTVLELGAGGGEITPSIIRATSEDTTIIAIEMLRGLYETGKGRLKTAGLGNLRRVNFYNGDALRFSDYLEEKGIDRIDAIISGLPLALLDKKRKERLLEESKTYLGLEGLFVQYQYTPFSRKTLRRYFEEVKVIPVLRNLPPAFVYSCRNPNPNKA